MVTPPHERHIPDPVAARYAADPAFTADSRGLIDDVEFRRGVGSHPEGRVEKARTAHPIPSNVSYSADRP